MIPLTDHKKRKKAFKTVNKRSFTTIHFLRQKVNNRNTLSQYRVSVLA